MMLSSIFTGRGYGTLNAAIKSHTLIVGVAWFAKYVSEEECKESEDIWYALALFQSSKSSHMYKAPPWRASEGKLTGLDHPAM